MAATDVFVCPRVPAMARKSVRGLRGLRCLIRAAQHIHISLQFPIGLTSTFCFLIFYLFEHSLRINMIWAFDDLSIFM